MKLCSTFILGVLVLVVAVSCEEQVDTNAKPVSQASREGTVENRLKLYEELTKNYKKGVNPDASDVQFGISLIDVDIDEERSTLESNVWLKLTWRDSRLKWDTTKHPVTVLRMDFDSLWHPDITLYNSADLSKSSTACWKSNTLVYPDGKILWVPPCHFSSFCKTTLKTNPYDPQTCFLKFGSWTFDSEIMDLNFYHNQSSIDISDLWGVSEWKVLSTNAMKHVKRYECCTEPYSDLTFNITLARKPASDSLCTV